MSDTKTVAVQVDGNRTLEIDPGDTKTIGEFADRVAKEHNVAGREFSFKADGDVLERKATVGKKVADAKIVELVEVSEPTEPGVVPPMAESAEIATEAQKATDSDVVPDGNVDSVLDWVRGNEAGSEPTEGWQERAQQALDVEAERADPRSGVTEPLERALEQDAAGAGNQ